MVINKLLTKINLTKTNNVGRIKYIVIHYVGALGGAEANCKYYASKYIGASAHYFVGHSGEIWQCVEDKDTAWHCGAKKYKHPECRNANSIGVEMCVRKGSNWYFEDATVNSTVELVKDLMKKYNIPVENVIRHYDVTGKTCPEPYVRDVAAWNKFKDRLVDKPAAKPVEEPKAEFKPYLVKVTADALNVRAGAGTKYKINTVIRDKGTYTIVEEKMNGSTKWGKLKSGAGWISLKYTKRV